MENIHRQNNFDIIRLLAAIMVIITHCYALLGKSETDILYRITLGTMQFSHLGVAIFFIISGYLITNSVMHSPSIKNYLWKRSLRIFPGLLVVLLFSIFIIGALVTTISISEYFSLSETYEHLLSLSLFHLNLNLPGVFKNNPIHAVNGSLWTLAYEFSFYILILIAELIGLLKKRFLIMIIWFLMLITRLYVGDNYFTYSYGTPFLLGLNITYFFEWGFYFLTGAIALLFKHKLNFDIKGLIALAIIYIIIRFFKAELPLRISYYIIIPYTVFLLAFLKGKLNDISKIGDLSYGIYIYAFPIQQTIVHFFHKDISVIIFFLLSIICTIPFAYLSWHLIENRFLSLKNVIK